MIIVTINLSHYHALRPWGHRKIKEVVPVLKKLWGGEEKHTKAMH
jgi:hypothetical protein